MKMEAVMNATKARSQFSEFIDSVVRDKPQFMKRNRDVILSFSEAQVEQLLSKYRFNVQVEVEEDDSFTVVMDEMDLIGAGDTKDEAIDDLAEQMVEYAQEYYQEFSLYSQSPNRADHFPYILLILTQDSIDEVKALIND